jgi:hypothetical protein
MAPRKKIEIEIVEQNPKESLTKTKKTKSPLK